MQHLLPHRMKTSSCEYDDIDVLDVVMLEIPWLRAAVNGSNLPYGSSILNPTLNPFSSPKHTPQLPPKQQFVTSSMVQNIAYYIGAQAN